jgi:hypothetical protein
MQRLNRNAAHKRSARIPRRAVLAPGVVLVLAACALAFRTALVPWMLSPLPSVDLAEPDPWFIDWRLAALRYHPERCKTVLVAPHIDARPIADHALRNGCGWSNAVRMFQAGGIRASFATITCETAAALALWLQHGVQAAAVDLLGQRVLAVRSLGTYSCRNILGNPLLKYRRSEHSTANAVDIAAFTLADGSSVSVRAHWNDDSAKARFLKAVHARACRYFHVVLGPDYNAAHSDHFHLDRGPMLYCR